MEPLHIQQAKAIRTTLAQDRESEAAIAAAEDVFKGMSWRVLLTLDEDGHFPILAIFDEDGKRCATLPMETRTVKTMMTDCKRLHLVARMLDKGGRRR